jgi:hypothetical protein
LEKGQEERLSLPSGVWRGLLEVNITGSVFARVIQSAPSVSLAGNGPVNQTPKWQRKGKVHQGGEEPQCRKPSAQVPESSSATMLSLIQIDHHHFFHQLVVCEFWVRLLYPWIMQRDEAESISPIKGTHTGNLLATKLALPIEDHHVT